eukprot:c9846_g1_i1 orf=963-1457(-)
METSAMVLPFRLGAQYDLLRRYSNPLPEPAEAVWVPSPLETNFRIDDLLDFSNSELCDEFTSDGAGEEASKEANSSRGDGSIELKVERSSSGMGQEMSEQAVTSGLCVPVRDLLFFVCVHIRVSLMCVCMCLWLYVLVCVPVGCVYVQFGQSLFLACKFWVTAS